MNGIAWKEIGSGPPLLLVNGYAATKDDWDPGFLENLSRNSTVICPDNRGMGESPPVNDGLSIDSMAGDAIELMDSLGHESFVVAGWSMGGFISQTIAARVPDRVERLVLMSTDPGGDVALPPNRDALRRLFDNSGTPDERARRLLDLLFPPELSGKVFEQFGGIVAEAQAKLDEEVLGLQQDAMKTWSRNPAEERLAAIRAETLVLTGSEDEVILPGNSERIVSHLPDSWLARFPGSAHAVMAQEAARVGALINAFLGR